MTAELKHEGHSVCSQFCESYFITKKQHMMFNYINRYVASIVLEIQKRLLSDENLAHIYISLQKFWQKDNIHEKIISNIKYIKHCQVVIVKETIKRAITKQAKMKKIFNLKTSSGTIIFTGKFIVLNMYIKRNFCSGLTLQWVGVAWGCIGRSPLLLKVPRTVSSEPQCRASNNP